MTFDLNSLPSITENAEVKVYHRTIAGRSRAIRIGCNTGVKAPAVTDTVAPFEVQGLEGKKHIKLRFHPDALADGYKLKASVFEMVRELLGAEWTLEPPVKVNDPLTMFKQLQNVFVLQTPKITVTENFGALLVWNVAFTDIQGCVGKKSSAAQKKQACERFMARAMESLKLCFRRASLGDDTALDRISGCSPAVVAQRIEIGFAKAGFERTLVAFELVDFPHFDAHDASHRLKYYASKQVAVLELTPCRNRPKRWVVPHHFGLVGHIRLLRAADWMIDCARFRVQEVLPDLSNSLTDYSKAMAYDSSTSSDDSSSDDEYDVRDIVIMATQPVDVEFRRPQPATPPPIRVPPPQPIARRTSFSGRFTITRVAEPANKPLHVDALSPSPTSNGCMVVSPSESVDSGVASPGILYDSDAAFRLTKMRDRSASECFPSLDAPLVRKGILKKTRNLAPLGVGLRRSPASRVLFTRSVSECNDSSLAMESVGDLEFLADNFCSRVSEGDESGLMTDSDDPPSEMVTIKKRVSFSEHVQARIYRSNSSILGQRKRNERKKQRRQRTDSDSTAPDDSPYGSSDTLFSGGEGSSLADTPCNGEPQNDSSDSAIGDELAVIGEEADADVHKHLDALSL